MKKRYLVLYLIGVLLLLVGIIFDKEIVSFLSQNRISALNQVISFFSFPWLGSIGFWAVILALMSFIFLMNNKKQWILPVWISMILSAIFVYILKLAFIRVRPFEALDIENLLSADGWSFPSGHATAVFSMWAMLDKEFSRLKWWWLAFAVLVAFSRLYTGVHYLTDVVAGALIGYTISLLVVMCKTRT